MNPVFNRRYLYEPALYIAPDTPDNNGTPYFPTAIKGGVNNVPGGSPAVPLLIAGMDPLPAGTVDMSEAVTCASFSNKLDPNSPPSRELTPEYCKAEFIWDVNSLNLSPGRYLAVFAVHDGDVDRGVGCIVIEIKP